MPHPFRSLTAGPVRWHGPVLLAAYIGFAVGAFFCFLRIDPQLVQRRLQANEREPEQGRIIRFGSPLLAAIFSPPGFDHRLGWSRAWLGAEPTWLEVFSLAMVLGAELAMARVLWINRYAGRTIRVEEDQKVIGGGPYRVVGHPIYAFTLVRFLFPPLVLGSSVALPALLRFLPIYLLRILNEEKVLRANLLGSTDYCYCERTRWRMVPGVW